MAKKLFLTRKQRIQKRNERVRKVRNFTRSNDARTIEYGGGISIAMVLFIVFLVLKLTNQINWGWGWVTAPLWISASIIVLIVGCFMTFIIVLFGIENLD